MGRRCRRRMTPTKLALLSLSLTFAITSVASADVLERRHDEGGDYYGFTDDLLHSDVAAPRGGSIQVRSGYQRAGLLRPRVSFVHAMRKSVEAL
jgi:hypothetical protein